MKKKSSRYTTLFSYKFKGVLHKGSYCKDGNDFHVDYRYSHGKDLHYASCTTVSTETAMKNFFYNKLKDSMGVGWIRMETKIRKALEPYEKKIEKIKSSYPEITLNCYRDIMGDFDNLDLKAGQEKLENWIKHS